MRLIITMCVALCILSTGHRSDESLLIHAEGILKPASLNIQHMM